MEGDQRRTRSRKKIEMATRQSAVLAKMMTEQPFDPQDPQQEFYRQDQSMGAEGDLLSIFGWRVADLDTHQQEPTLECMAVLTSELGFPISTATHLLERTAQGREETVRSLWIELTLITSSKSQDIFLLGKPTHQSRMFSFCYQQLLPLLKNFIKKYLSWQSIASGPHDNADLLEAFRKQVVQTANSNLEKGSTFQNGQE